MLSPAQCAHLRDQLFSHRLPGTSHAGPVYRYVAVTPGGHEGEAADATVHVAFAPAAWARAGLSCDPESVEAALRGHIAASTFHGCAIATVVHDYLTQGWPCDWGITAQESVNNMPVLVLLESAAGAVRGVLMREPHMGRTDLQMAEDFAEPSEVESLLASLESLPLHGQYETWYKESNLACASLEEALASTPQTDAGQKMVYLYRAGEWLSDIWNNPSKPNALPLSMRSFADFHGTRVSASKREMRQDLAALRGRTTLVGDYDVLLKAVELIRDPARDPDSPVQRKGQFEANAAVRTLANWWNAHAPQEHRHAALCRLYTWDASNRMFIAGDPEEPALGAEVIAEEPSTALFEREGLPTVAAVFYRGRAHNIEENGGTLTHYANGEAAWSIGLEVAQVDEAYYCAAGLRTVSYLLP